MANDNGDGPGRSVTSKVLAVLYAFSPDRYQLSLNEIAAQTKLPLSTSYRLATELVTGQALERATGGGYQVGLRLWEVGALAPSTATLPEIALPFMQDLYEATHENVQLAVLNGGEALYLEKLRGRRSVPVKTRRAGRLPLHATAVGKVLLAYAPKRFVEDVLGNGLQRYTPHTVVAPGHIRAALAEVRRTGVAFTRDELSMGVTSVASPLLDAGGNAVAAMSISVRSTGAAPQRLAPAVRTAALCASRALRARPALAVTGTGRGT
jgi:DNA-binding IclR family transcriptional regulator